jgi:precorrin-6B methylase 2
VEAFHEINIEPEIVQLSSARAKMVGGLHMMTAQNPIWIISGGGNG